MGLFTGLSKPMRVTLLAAISVGGWPVLRLVWPLIFAVALIVAGQWLFG